MGSRASKRKSKTRKRQPINFWWIGISLSVLCVLGGFVAYGYRHHVLESKLVANYSAKFHGWVASHKPAAVVTKKKIAKNQTEPSEPIEFEFYNDLPKMDVAGDDMILADLHSKAENQSKTLQKKKG